MVWQGHRWSGWPGAFCLDCGIGDPVEECLAVDCPNALKCECGGDLDPGHPGGDGHRLIQCPVHVVPECVPVSHPDK